MSIDTTKVRLLLRAHLKTVVGLPTVQQWENHNFVPPDAKAGNWIRELMEPAREVWGATNTIVHTGNYRVDVVVPAGSGTETMESISDAIKAAFHPGLSLSDVPKTCAVSINRSERLPARRDTRDRAWYSQPVLIRWVVYTTFQ